MLRGFCVYMFHGIFHSFGDRGIMESVCLLCSLRYGIWFVSCLSVVVVVVRTDVVCIPNAVIVMLAILGFVWLLVCLFLHVSVVHPVTMCSAVFCIVYSLIVSDMMRDRMVLLYSSIVLVKAVYVLINVSFDLSQWKVVSAVSIFVLFPALSVVFCMCFDF